MRFILCSFSRAWTIPCPKGGVRLPTTATVGKTSRAAYFRKYKRQRRAVDPEFRARNNQWTRDWRARNPGYAKQKGAERRADPEKYEGDKTRNREAMRAKRADPEYRERENARARARYQERKKSLSE